MRQALDASELGFFPLWTDTRTGIQEMFFSRISVNPADAFIRDSPTDTGTVPSPGNHWSAPDLIIRRQKDGDVTFINEDLLRDGVTGHWVYARATSKGPNTARNVRLAVTIGNYPSLQALIVVIRNADIQSGRALMLSSRATRRKPVRP